MPTVSVIIPCFNAEAFLSDTIQSVLNQTYKDFEIIVIDDGSTDNSGALIDSFGTKVRAEYGSNRGASAARNRGTDLANGEFMQYLDADDLLTRDALARRVEVLQQTDSDVAYSDWQRLVQCENRFALGDVVARRMESVHVDPQIATFSDFWCPPAALLYRRRIVEKIGRWNETLPVIQDARFLLDAALHNAQFIHVPGVGAFYRVHIAESLSRRSNRAFVRDCLENALQVESCWHQRDELTDERIEAVLNVLAYAARASFEGDRETFDKAVQAGSRLRPGWSPEKPPSLRFLSCILGYPRAEQCAVIYRHLKGALLGGLPK